MMTPFTVAAFPLIGNQRTRENWDARVHAVARAQAEQELDDTGARFAVEHDPLKEPWPFRIIKYELGEAEPKVGERLPGGRRCIYLSPICKRRKRFVNGTEPPTSVGN